VIGTLGGYFATFGYLQSNALDGVSSLGNVPVANLLLILLGMPLIAAAGGWLLAGRQPPSIAQRPME
jgi:putative ABC transport system permease protein